MRPWRGRHKAEVVGEVGHQGPGWRQRTNDEWWTRTIIPHIRKLYSLEELVDCLSFFETFQVTLGCCKSFPIYLTVHNYWHVTHLYESKDVGQCNGYTRWHSLIWFWIALEQNPRVMDYNKICYSITNRI